MARTLPDLPTLTVLADPSEPITCPAQALKRLYQIEKTDPQKCAGLLSGDLVLMDNPLKLTNDLQAINVLIQRKGKPRTMVLIEEQNLTQNYHYTVDMNSTETALMNEMMNYGFPFVDATQARRAIADIGRYTRRLRMVTVDHQSSRPAGGVGP